MPLTYVNIDEEGIVKKISGANEIKHHLENLGFVQGSKVRVVNKMNGNIIVFVKNTRIAISEELARKIMV